MVKVNKYKDEQEYQEYILRKLELNTLAAKAMGYDIVNSTFDGGLYLDDGNPYDIYWNPMDYPGDALNLAIALRLKIIPGKYINDGCTVESYDSSVCSCTVFMVDKEEQTRFAIVKVAAEIGKKIQTK